MANHLGASAPPEIERRIYRKLLLRIMPIIMIGMFISYIDRANIGVLAEPMSEDLGLTASAFGLAAGLFYIGYCFMEIPSNMALAKFGARRWIARIMFSWGAVTMLMAAVQNEFTLYVVRIMLGVAEAGFSPGALLFLAMWCPPRILTKAYSLMNLAVPFALATGSVLTSALLSLDGLLGLAGWRWAFLLEGLPALLLAAYIWFRLPSSPTEAHWLSTEEKAYLAETGVQGNNASAHEPRQLLAVLRRPAAWMFTVLYFCMTIGYWSITYFLPTIVKERFELGAAAAGLVSALPWVFAAVVMLVVARTVTRTGERTWHLTFLQLAGAVGLTIAASTGSAVLALVGVSLAGAGFFGSLSTFQTMQAQAFAGGLAAVALAMVNGLASLSGLAGPYVMGVLKDATGSTDRGLMIMSTFFVAAAIMVNFMSRWTDRVTAILSNEPAVEPATAAEK
ncbi:MFS transporter [Saccharopolyspora hordei]|uniref:MFS family permease n=1 Tax=Saccharopolyspora hordei TaxID=1838 RepID=A0A853AUS4_9PSEU|nr:MFS transporter [Saccharopolyspora hordei]NYI86405.1 MFS family permease [Saccharopolyspora hordei]